MELDFTKIIFPADFEYSSDDEHLPIEFYLNVLPKSKVIYLKLGYFSSSAIRVLAYGFAQFIYNGGIIKIITNHFLYEDDLSLIKNDAIQEPINSFVINDLNWLYENLSSTDKHFFDCLRYLVSKNRLEIIPVMLKPGKMAHYKQGVFIDSFDNKIFMDGSCNFTASGLLENAEVISLYRSWGSEFEESKVNTKYEEIKKIVHKKSDLYEYLKSDSIINAVYEIGEEKTVDDLLDDERLIFDKSKFSDIKKIVSQYEQAIKDIHALSDMPRFPYPEGPREYQKEAYSNWLDANKQGIFAMATGTGKTITALNCLLNEYINDGYYQAIIVVPTKILLNQWADEVNIFSFSNIIKISSEYKDWKVVVRELKAGLLFNKNKNFIIIVTYSTFGTDSFQTQIKNLPKSTIFIADEAHNIAQNNVKKLLPDISFDRKIALSATPKRAYDPVGNDVIEKFFNSYEPYTFALSMEKAIEQGYLSEYFYYPHIVSLNDEEMTEYISISKELLKYFDFETMALKQIKPVEILLQNRKRIIHKASSKLVAFKNILENKYKDGDSIKYSFVYAPEGEDSDGNNLIDLYMKSLEQTYPSAKSFAYTSQSQNKNEIIRNFENGLIDVLFSMKCLDEGVDIPRAELAIFCSSTGNPRQFIQRRGRVLRRHPDKKYSEIHDLIVIPTKYADINTFQIERNLVRSELVRVVYFASLAKNYYESMEVCSNIAEFYDLDMYALESKLRSN